MTLEASPDSSVQIVELTATEAEARLPELAKILVDAVEGGASVGFVLPFGLNASLAFWRTIVSDVAARRTVLSVALLDGRAVGTVQLKIATMPNQCHRADVSKLLVHRSARRRGIGRTLMERIEEIAHRESRTLLTLDTLADSDAEQLYHSLGYVKFGTVPDHARLPNGEFRDTAFFYKQL